MSKTDEIKQNNNVKEYLAMLFCFISVASLVLFSLNSGNSFLFYMFSKYEMLYPAPVIQHVIFEFIKIVFLFSKIIMSSLVALIFSGCSIASIILAKGKKAKKIILSIVIAIISYLLIEYAVLNNLMAQDMWPTYQINIMDLILCIKAYVLNILKVTIIVILFMNLKPKKLVKILLLVYLVLRLITSIGIIVLAIILFQSNVLSELFIYPLKIFVSDLVLDNFFDIFNLLADAGVPFSRFVFSLMQYRLVDYLTYNTITVILTICFVYFFIKVLITQKKLLKLLVIPLAAIFILVSICCCFNLVRILFLGFIIIV